MESVKQCPKKFQPWKGFKEKKGQKWIFETQIGRPQGDRL